LLNGDIWTTNPYQKLQFLENIISIRSLHNDELDVVGGDFNLIKYLEEKNVGIKILEP